MTSARLSAFTAAAALALGATHPAMAMSGRCFWNQLRPQTRDILLDAYQRQGPAGIDPSTIGDAELQAMDETCGAGRADVDLKERMLAAVVFEQGSAAILTRALEWDGRALDAAWDRLSPDDRSLLNRGAEAVLDGAQTPREDLAPIVSDFLGEAVARRQPPAVADEARGYLTSRALIEAIERRG